MEMIYLGSQTGTVELRFTNRTEVMGERILDTEDKKEVMDTLVKEKCYIYKIWAQKNLGNLDHSEKMKSENTRNRGKGKKSQVNGTENICTKSEKKVSLSFGSIPTKEQETCRTPNIQDQRRNSHDM